MVLKSESEIPVTPEAIEIQNGSVDSEDPKHVGTLEYPTIALVQIGEVIGAGMLTLPSAFKQLGWVMGIFFLVFMGSLNMFIGFYLSEAKQKFPELDSFASYSKLVFQNQKFKTVVQVTLIIYTIFTMSSYVVGMVESLQMVFFESDLCNVIWGLIVVLYMALPVQLRNLTEARFLIWANLGFIMVTVFCAVIYMLVNMQEHLNKFEIETYVFPDNMTWLDFFGGLSQIAFSYCASYFYLEMMQEMRDPGDFPKAVAIAVPFQTSVYLTVAIIGYIYDGNNSQDMITKMIDPRLSPAVFRIASITLFLHLNISYLIFATMCTRKLHEYFHYKTLNDFTRRGRGVWAIISLTLLVSCFIIANIIPYFGIIVSIIGSVFIPFLGLFLPAVLTYFCRKMIGRKNNFVDYFVIFCLVAFSIVLTFAGTAANFVTLAQTMQRENSTIFECEWTSYLDHLPSLNTSRL